MPQSAYPQWWWFLNARACTLLCRQRDGFLLSWTHTARMTWQCTWGSTRGVTSARCTCTAVMSCTSTCASSTSPATSASAAAPSCTLTRPMRSCGTSGPHACMLAAQTFGCQARVYAESAFELPLNAQGWLTRCGQNAAPGFVIFILLSCF